MTGVIVLTVFVVAYALVAGRVERSPVPPPMVFVGAGALAGVLSAPVEVATTALLPLLEVTLVLILFSDAARVDLTALRRRFRMPMRLLLVGLPLTVAIGFVTGLVVLPSLGLAGALLASVMLAPTDAALGEAVVENPAVPAHVRQAAKVESGLNDGLVVPMLAAATVFASMEEGGEGVVDWLVAAAVEVGVGTAFGGTVGWIGAWAFRRASQASWTTPRFRKIGAAALALLAFLGADALGASGFLAAFVAGGVFGHRARDLCGELLEFADTEGRLLALVSFFLFGVAAVPSAWRAISPRVVVYAILSLTVVRMVPVALALAGRRYRLITMGYLGWFGPRGIASIVFLVAVREQLGDIPVLSQTVTITVMLSIVLHGLSAKPLSERYGRAMGGLGAGAPEAAGGPEVWQSSR